MDVGSCTQGESTQRIDLVVLPASPASRPGGAWSRGGNRRGRWPLMLSLRSTYTPFARTLQFNHQSHQGRD